MQLPKPRTENIVMQQLNKELLIYDLIINKAFCLNETSTIIFNACDGVTSLDKLKHQSGFTEDLIYLGLEELQKNNLIENTTIKHFEGLSRREVIRKVGYASLVTLPVISSLVAPEAVNAQSGTNLALGQTCSSPTQCSSAAPNCAQRVPGSGRRCCIGSTSYYDTGGVVNSCSGGVCGIATFSCQSDANDFCCTNSATASCSGNSCACRCD